MSRRVGLAVLWAAAALAACPRDACPDLTVCESNADCVEGRVCSPESGCCIEDGGE